MCRLNRFEWNRDTVKSLLGSRWAFRLTEKIRNVRFFETGTTPEAIFGLISHNSTVPDRCHVGESNPLLWVSKKVGEQIEQRAADRASELAEAEAAKLRLLRETLTELNHLV